MSQFLWLLWHVLHLEQAVLFCAARTSLALAPYKPYIFQQITAVRGSSYNLSTGYFTPQTSGTYVFHLSSAVPNGTTIKLDIEGDGLDVEINRQTTKHNGWDTTSRDVIYTLTQGAQILLNLNGGSSVSDQLRQTSWSAFLLDTIMSPVITFSAGLNGGTTMNGIVNYTNTLVNVGNAWNLTTDTFTAPRNGIYVFSVSCGVRAGETFKVYIYLNSFVIFQLSSLNSEQNGTDVFSRTFAVSLSAGDTVHTYLVNGNIFSSPAYQTSFAGFLYEPLNGRKVIWSVHQTNNINIEYNPFPFDDVNVNIGNGWNSSNNSFVAPFAGVYQLHLTATSMASSQIDFRLYWNNVAYANIYSTTTKYNMPVTRSRAIMIDAAAGDTFFIATSSSTRLSSNLYRLISFTGFLISS